MAMRTNFHTDKRAGNIFMDKELLREKLRFVLGLSNGLRRLMFTFLEVENISDKDFNSLLSLAEALETNFEKLYVELS